MTEDLLFSLTALVSLLPVAVVGFRREPPSDGLYWLLLAVAVIVFGVLGFPRVLARRRARRADVGRGQDCGPS